MAFRMGKKEYDEMMGKATGDFTAEEKAASEEAKREERLSEEELRKLEKRRIKEEKAANRQYAKENAEYAKIYYAAEKAERKRKREVARGREYGDFKDEKSASKMAKKLAGENRETFYSVYREPTDDGQPKYVIGKRGLTNSERSKFKADRKQAKARTKWVKKQGKSVTRASENIAKALQPGGVPQYTPPNMDFGKSGYTPLKYRPVEGVKQYRGVSGEPYYRPSNAQGKPYEPVSDAPYYRPSTINQSGGGVMSSAPEGSGVMSQGKLYEPIFGRKVPFTNSQPTKRVVKKSRKSTNARFKSQ